jgi:DNA-binding response OmpR family regulator
MSITTSGSKVGVGERQGNPLVLVADDEPSMLELVARHLKTMHDPKLEVIEASDGETAWRLAREHLPDLVVLDVMMPGMSGWEVCRKIREDVALAHTGVVMLTGIGENLNQMTSPLYGADAYIDKPFEFEELDEKVKTALEARASQREGVSRPAVNGVGGAAKAAKAKGSVKKAAPKAKLARKASKKPLKAKAKRAAPAKRASKKRTPKKAPKKRR